MAMKRVANWRGLVLVQVGAGRTIGAQSGPLHVEAFRSGTREEWQAHLWLECDPAKEGKPVWASAVAVGLEDALETGWHRLCLCYESLLETLLRAKPELEARKAVQGGFMDRSSVVERKKPAPRPKKPKPASSGLLFEKG